MADVVLVRNRIESGRVDRLREWTAELRSREDEAIETLRNEGVHTEAAFLERTDDGAYLYYFVEADDVDRALEAYASSSHEIDREHREVMADVLADDQDERPIEMLYHVTNPDRP